ncbi:thymidylate kinase [Streptomyces sp. 110]|uniref:Thymidylate kinase n=1 Tax=Streptomyces endocoffeicus TaxID=2898945 RepID=A0ABS1Q9R7_9ACTN|nr:thymidylate kinase [Streptomyces endocoffeicus]MBL1120922.1 thymidylate kinase [Streptomyces endocoffeicus]
MILPSAYQPVAHGDRHGLFLVLEGVSGIGKSTLTKTLADRLGAAHLHTLPSPHSGWSTTVNSRLRPLPQFAFYLSGLLHAADTVAHYRAAGPVIADRYASSVVACHSAVHGVDMDDAAHLLAPFRPYLETPDSTFYLRCSEPVLRRRLASKERGNALTTDDSELLTVPGRLPRLLANFEAAAHDDPTAVVLDTDDKTPDELADWVINHLETTRAQTH